MMKFLFFGILLNAEPKIQKKSSTITDEKFLEKPMRLEILFDNSFLVKFFFTIS